MTVEIISGNSGVYSVLMQLIAPESRCIYSPQGVAILFTDISWEFHREFLFFFFLSQSRMRMVFQCENRAETSLVFEVTTAGCRIQKVIIAE
jgi:hypothetical protein